MMLSTRWLSPLALLLALTSCGRPNSSSLDAQQLKKQQGLEDFDALTATMRRLYGPLSYKEKRFNFKFDDLVQKKRAEIEASTGDTDTFAALKSFLSSFHDGHISIEIPGNANDIYSYNLPLYVTPVEGKYVIAVKPTDADLGIAQGDELLSVDGQTPKDLLQTIKRYEAFATEASDEHWVIRTLRRPFYIKELIPTKSTALLALQRKDGTQYSLEIPWTMEKTDGGDAGVVAPHGSPITNFTAEQAKELFRGAEGTLLTMGAVEPFFTSEAVRNTFKLVKVTPNDEFLKKYDLTAKTMPDIYAALYKYQDKTILLVRQPGYEPPEGVTPDTMLAGYRAILDQFQDLADVLVIDQTHNPGGDLDYAAGFFQLFVKDSANNLVQHLHADRKWVFDLQEAAADAKKAGKTTFSTEMTLAATVVDQALDAGVDLTKPLPLVGLEHLKSDAKFTWTKPILVLADELAGSCGDIFPMYMQRNGVAKIFGQTTMGLGGNVEPLVTLPNSQATVHLTRGLYTTYRADGSYSDDDIVENNGIKPDLPHKITLADFRGGFVDYVTAFSKAAVAAIPAPTSTPAAAQH